MHEADARSSSHIHPPPSSIQALFALRNCGWLWFLQLRCADTLHCSCLTFGASGEEKLGWQDKRNELICEKEQIAKGGGNMAGIKEAKWTKVETHIYILYTHLSCIIYLFMCFVGFTGRIR